MANIKKIKIGTNTYDIVDNSAVHPSGTTPTTGHVALWDGSKVIKDGGTLGSAAFAATTAFDAAGAADSAKTAAISSAKSYTDTQINDLITELGQLMHFQGTVATESALKAIKGAKKGDVYIVTADSSEWVATADAASETATTTWEKFGTTDVSGALFKGNNTLVSGDILVADGTNGKAKTRTATEIKTDLGLTNVVGQNSTVTASHVAVWHADHTIKDGGALGTAAFVSTDTFDNAGAATTALERAKQYADSIIVTSSGAHTHTLSASGSCTPALNKTTKYLSASASGGAVTLGGTTTFLTGASLTTKNLVKSSIAVGGMVTDISQAASSSSSFSAHAASYDSTNECLVLSPASNTFITDVGAVTATKNSAAITYATGTVDDTGTGDAVGTSISPTTGSVSIGTFTQPTITLASNDSTATGRVAYFSAIDGKSTSVTVTGTATSTGSEHTHNLDKAES